MKNSLVLLIATAALVFFPAAAKAANLLANPGFEIEGTGGPSKAADWDIWTGERLLEYKHNGDWSLHSWGFDGAGDAGAWQGKPVSPGTKISFQGYLMSPSEGGFHKSPLAGSAEAFLEIEWWQGATKLDSVKSNSLKGASDWMLYSVTGVAPAGADSARFVCKVVSVPGSSGDVYFDDLDVTSEVSK